MVLNDNSDRNEDDNQEDEGVDILLGGLNTSSSAANNKEFREMPGDDEVDSGTQSHGGAAKPNVPCLVPIGEAPPQERSAIPKWLSHDYADTCE